MHQVLAEHQDQSAVTGDQDPVRRFAAEGPVTRSRIAGIFSVLGRVVMVRSSSALDTSPDAVVKSGSRS
jgi:hypothetical protein